MNEFQPLSERRPRSAARRAQAQRAETRRDLSRDDLEEFTDESPAVAPPSASRRRGSTDFSVPATDDPRVGGRRDATRDAVRGFAVHTPPDATREDLSENVPAPIARGEKPDDTPARRLPKPDPGVAAFIRRRPAPLAASAPTQAAQRFAAWEDTSTHLAESEQKTFFKKQPAWFWVLCAFLLVSLFTVLLLVGTRMWREAAEQRAEARRLQQIAEEKAKYKLLYRDLIEDYAAEQEVDPAFVAAVIYNESRFDPNAVSRVGARGLMQIMEDTGQWIAGKLDEADGYTFDTLFNPEKNLRFGIWYLGFLSKRFGGDPVKMAAGYHAGQNAVSSWLDNPEYSHDGWTLDAIPYPDTDQYVKKVVSAYEIYTRHYYTPEETEPPVESLS